MNQLKVIWKWWKDEILLRITDYELRIIGIRETLISNINLLVQIVRLLHIFNYTGVAIEFSELIADIQKIHYIQ